MVQGAPGQKDPLPSSEGVKRDEELVLALNAKSITPSMSAPSSSSVSSATPNFGKYHIMKISSECFSGVWMNTLWQRKGISISPTRILPNFNNTSIHYKRPAREPLLGLLGVVKPGKKGSLFNHSNMEKVSSTQVWRFCCALPGHQSLPSTTSALSAFVNPGQFSSSLVWDQISTSEQQQIRLKLFFVKWFSVEYFHNYAIMWIDTYPFMWLWHGARSLFLD